MLKIGCNILGTLMRFEIKNDLGQIQLSAANAFHFVISATLAALFGFWTAWLVGIVWEIGDGFKPWYWQAPAGTPWWKRELFYSDKFSLQDVFIWDLGGCVLGVLIRGML